MTFRAYILYMSLASILCWVAWFFVLWNISPDQAGGVGFTFFYLSLFLGVVGTCSLINFCLRKLLLKHEEIVFRHTPTVFRQSILVALFIVSSLILLANDLLPWWGALLLSLFYISIEGIFFTQRKYRNQEYAG